ncbi:MAG TPA: STAS domain-containing protein [Natronosporangium sp.]|nr:STAS domain-containing protein [Natronosporangium sp.]
MKLTIVSGDTDGATTVAVSGDLDLATAAELERKVERLVAGGTNRLVVDLHHVSFCDSAGLNALVRARNRCDAAGGWLRITRPVGEVAEVLRISGLLERLAGERTFGES